MILISGTTLMKEDLPNFDIMDYQIENDTHKMGIKLKTSAKSPTCFQIYISEDFRTEYTITDELAEKLVYFASDSDLIKMLNGEDINEEEDCFKETEVVVPVFEKPNPVVFLDKKDEEENKSVELPISIDDPVAQASDVSSEKEVVVPVIEEKKSNKGGKSSKSNGKKPKVNLDKEEIADSDNNSQDDVSFAMDSKDVDNIGNDEVSVVELSEKNENIESNMETKDSVLPKVELPSISFIKREEPISVVPEIELEMANTELPESFLMIPNINDDVDSLKMLLKTKEAIISQKDGIIQDLKNKIDEAYKLQEMQLVEVETAYKQKMMECQNLISELEQRGAGVNLDEETSKFLKFINYARSSKAIVKEGFSEDEVMKLGALRSKYTIFSYASGDSSYLMYKQIKKYIDRGRDCLILDFSNDNFLASVYKLNSKQKNTMGLFRDDISPLALLSEVANTKFIPTTSFNDIALLNVDWGYTLRKIDDLAGGKDVILVFGGINNFNVRYTVSKLATIGKLFIFAKCSPVVLSSLYSDVQFLPKNRVRIVALEYIDMVKTILSELSKSFEIFAFSGDVEWHKLELK